MLFASFDFLLFFAVAFAAYWTLSAHPRLRALWVVLASYFFYMAAPKPLEGPLPTPWYFAGLLLLSTVVDYAAGLLIARARSGRDRQLRAGRFWLSVSLLTNLGLLAFFKYTGFLSQVANDAAALVGVSQAVPVLHVLLPVGISFYTFQSLSYTIDVYRGHIEAERSFLRFAAFIAFFPQLMAGPIIRASEFLPQFRQRPSLTREDVDFAMWRIGKGLAKKVLLSDFLAVSFTDRVFASPAEHSSLENLLALYAFTLQIYADFSGYSDIAIGTGRLLGIRMPENFNRPYQAVDIADFWRRWHMTLSSWLRDYVYYPLGGSRLGPARTYVNLWVTMFLVGIWHGASWNFVIYAFVQASAMVYNRACRSDGGLPSRLARVGVVSVGVAIATTLLAALGLRLDNPWSFGLGCGVVSLLVGALPRPENVKALLPVHVLLTVHFSVFTRVFFRAEDLDSARAMVGKLMAWDGLGLRMALLGNETLARLCDRVSVLTWARPLADLSVLLVLLSGFALHYTSASRVENAALRLMPRTPAVLVGVGFAVMLGALSLLLAGPRPNIYFAF